MTIKIMLPALFALALAGCTPATLSHSVSAGPLFNSTTVGGIDYPVIVEGAETIGLNPVLVAQNMRFPHSLGAGGSFRAIAPADAPATHARLRIHPGQPHASSTLTFVHGERNIASGTFSMAPEAYRDPRALGNVSAVLITDMLDESARLSNGDGFFFRRFF